MVMSDIHNHTLCALQTVETINNEELLRIIGANKELYLFGAMGGDIFLYFHFLKGDAWADGIATQFHTDPDILFPVFAKYYRTVPKSDSDAMISYLSGFVSHHSLDVKTHPFINWFAGFEIDADPSTEKYRYCHKRLEIILDVLYAEHCKVPMVSLDFLNRITEKDLALVTALMQFTLKELKKEQIPDNMLAMCVSDCKQLLSLSSKPALYRALRFREQLGGVKYRYTRPFFFVSKQERDADPLNLSHRFWHHPNDASLSMNYSYPELFSYACSLGAINIYRYYSYLLGHSKDIDRIFRHSGFVSGLSETTAKEKQNMHPILL